MYHPSSPPPGHTGEKFVLTVTSPPTTAHLARRRGSCSTTLQKPEGASWVHSSSQPTCIGVQNVQAQFVRNSIHHRIEIRTSKVSARLESKTRSHFPHRRLLSRDYCPSADACGYTPPSASCKRPRKSERTKLFSPPRSSYPAPPFDRRPNAYYTSSSHLCRNPCNISTTYYCNLSSRIYDCWRNQFVDDTPLLDRHSRGPYPVHGLSLARGPLCPCCLCIFLLSFLAPCVYGGWWTQRPLKLLLKKTLLFRQPGLSFLLLFSLQAISVPVL